MTETSENEFAAVPEINCPSCGSQIDISQHGAEIICPVCSNRFVLTGHLCPSCGEYHEEEQAACLECGSPLVRLCRHCQGANWTGDDVCHHCGQRIDFLSQIEAQSMQTTPQRLSRQMAAAKELNASESEASDRRMAELMAIEETRQAELRRQRARRQRQERTMLIIIFGAVLLFLLILLGYALISTLV